MEEWVIDATMGVRDGFFCFCPVRLGADGEIESVVVGMNYLSDAPPPEGEVVGVVHEDGQEAVEAFCKEHEAALDEMRRRSG